MKENDPKMPETASREPEEDRDGDHYHGVWEYGVSASARPPSKDDLSSVRKEMIRFALEHHIRDIRTYSGYKGDLLVQITATDFELLTLLKSHAESLGMQTVIKKRSDIGIHEIYCITPDEEVYGLKPAEV